MGDVRRYLLAALSLTISATCVGQLLTTPAAQPASVAWDDSPKGVKLKYPDDWKPQKTPDFELMLLPVGALDKSRRITLDVPDLPPHLAFMIRMSRVEHGYLDDLKKEHPDLHVTEASDANVPGAVARLLRSSWRVGKQTYDDVVLLMIHDGSVYILDAQSDDPDLPPSRTAFDFIRASLAWTKK